MELTVVVHHEPDGFWSEVPSFQDASRPAQR